MCVCCEDRPYRWPHIRVVAGYEIREPRYSVTLLPLPFQMLGSSPEVFRVLMEVLVIDGAGVARSRMCVDRDISWIGERIFHPLRVSAPEFIREAQVDVVQEPTQVHAVVPGRIEGLHDIFLASFAVLGRGRQVPNVNQQVLRPDLQILRLCGLSACFRTQRSRIAPAKRVIAR